PYCPRENGTRGRCPSAGPPGISELDQPDSQSGKQYVDRSDSPINEPGPYPSIRASMPGADGDGNRISKDQFETRFRTFRLSLIPRSQDLWGYGLDKVGNRTNRNSTVAGVTNQSFTFNTNDWQSTDAYDGDGNTTG